MTTHGDGTSPTPSQPAKRVGSGVVVTWARFAVAAVVGVAQAPILFRSLAASDLGVWYLFYAVATFVNVSDLGLPAAFGRAVSFLWGRELAGGAGQRPELEVPHLSVPVSELYASALLATVILSLGFAAVSAPAALLYFQRALPPGATSDLLGPLLVFLVGVVLNLTATIPGVCLSGIGHVALDSGLRIAASVVGFGLVVFVIPGHPSLYALSAIYAAQGAFALASSHTALARCRREIGQIRSLRMNVGAMRSLFRESMPVLVSRLGLWLTVESTLLIAGYFFGSGRIADFGVLRQVITLGASVTTAIPIALSPHVAAAHAAGDDVRARSLYSATLRYSLIVNVLWTIGLLLWAPSAIGLIVGPEHFIGLGVLVPLSLGSLTELHASAHGYFVWNTGRWPFAPYIIAAGVLNVAFASTGAALWGFEGLAWGTVAAQAVTMSWVQVAYALARAGISFRAYARDCLRPGVSYAIALALCAVAVRLIASRLAPSGGALPDLSGKLKGAVMLLAGVGLTSALAAALAWTLVLTPADRTYFLDISGIRRCDD